VAMIGAAPYVLVVYPGLAANNVAELIALAKAKPGALNYGSAGVASLAHLGHRAVGHHGRHQHHSRAVQGLGPVGDRAIARGFDDCRDYESHGLATAFGARFPCRRGAQAPQAQARLEEGGRHPGLPDRWPGTRQARALQVRAPVVLSTMPRVRVAPALPGNGTAMTVQRPRLSDQCRTPSPVGCIVNTFECDSSWVGLCISSFCGASASTLDGRSVGFSTRRDNPSNREFSSIDND
jgi:hypothetical protein